jgi:hypothetical protein
VRAGDALVLLIVLGGIAGGGYLLWRLLAGMNLSVPGVPKEVQAVLDAAAKADLAAQLAKAKADADAAGASRNRGRGLANGAAYAATQRDMKTDPKHKAEPTEEYVADYDLGALAGLKNTVFSIVVAPAPARLYINGVRHELSGNQAAVWLRAFHDHEAPVLRSQPPHMWGTELCLNDEALVTGAYSITGIPELSWIQSEWTRLEPLGNSPALAAWIPATAERGLILAPDVDLLYEQHSDRGRGLATNLYDALKAVEGIYMPSDSNYEPGRSGPPKKRG